MQVADIVNTHSDKFARLVRRDLRRRGIDSGVTVVFSPEPAAPHSMREVPRESQSKFKRSFYGTMPYMPAVFGMQAAAYVTAELSGFGRQPVRRSVPRAVARRQRKQGDAARQRRLGDAGGPPQVAPSERGASHTCVCSTRRGVQASGTPATVGKSSAACASQDHPATTDDNFGLGRDSVDKDDPKPMECSESESNGHASSTGKGSTVQAQQRRNPVPPGVMFDI